MTVRLVNSFPCTEPTLVSSWLWLHDQPGSKLPKCHIRPWTHILSRTRRYYRRELDLSSGYSIVIMIPHSPLPILNLSFSTATQTKPLKHPQQPTCQYTTAQSAYLARVWCTWDILCDLQEVIRSSMVVKGTPPTRLVDLVSSAGNQRRSLLCNQLDSSRTLCRW